MKLYKLIWDSIHDAKHTIAALNLNLKSSMPTTEKK